MTSPFPVRDTFAPAPEVSQSPGVLVRQFNEAFQVNLPAPDAPPTLDYPELPKRMNLIAEEYCELLEAVYGPAAARHVSQAIAFAQAALDEGVRDLVETADAAADLTVVLYGLADETNIPHDHVLVEVHESNMSKLGRDGKPILREDRKILKGPDTFRPNVRGLLRSYGADV